MITEGDELQLMYSMDGGKSWQDAAGIPGGTLNINGHTAVLDGLEINRDYLFKIVVYGGAMEGESQPVPFYYYENDCDRWEHGDRDGDGREEQKETLPDYVPPLFSGNSLWDSDGAKENLTGASEKKEEALPAAGENGIAAKEPEAEDESQSHRTETENSSVSSGKEEGGGSEYGLSEESGGNESDRKAAEQGSRPCTAASDGPGPGSAVCQATNIILTFRQFNDQLQVNENWITLTGDGIRVELPAAGLRELRLEEDEVFDLVLA